MTTDFTGSDVWHDTITGPSNAEDVTAASVIDPMTLMADREIWLKSRLVGCGRILEHKQVTSSSLLGSLIDLKTTTAWTLIPGITLTLANAAEVGDIILASASAQVFYKGTTVGTNYIKLALSTPASSSLPNGSAQVVSKEDGDVTPVHLSLNGKVAIAGGTDCALYGACATSSDNDFATVFSPFSLRVVHLRPVAAP